MTLLSIIDDNKLAILVVMCGNHAKPSSSGMGVANVLDNLKFYIVVVRINDIEVDSGLL